MLIHRCYENDVFLSAFSNLKARGIRTCVHLINGLPTETIEQMLDNARQLGQLQPNAVKLQLLHVIQDTPLEKWYQDGRLSTLDQETYVALIAEQLTYFPPETVIERLTGDGDARTLVAPLWSRNKRGVLNAIAAYQKSHNLVQGISFLCDWTHLFQLISFSRIFYTISTWEPPLHKILVLSNMVTFHGNHSFSTKYKLKSFPFHWTHLFQLFCKLPAQIGSSCHKNHPFACKISFRHLFSRLSPSIQDRHHLALGSHLCCQSEFSVGTVTLVKSHSIFQSANFIISLACDQFF